MLVQRRKPYSSGGRPVRPVRVRLTSRRGDSHSRRADPSARDAAATPRRGSAPARPAARDTLLAALDAGWADPRRLHAEGRRARALLDQAREVRRRRAGRAPARGRPSCPTARPRCARASRAAVRRAPARGARLVASRGRALRGPRPRPPPRGHGRRPDRCSRRSPVDRLGRVDLDALGRAPSAAPGTVAAALQRANGEVGTRQPLAEARASVPRPPAYRCWWTRRPRWAATPAPTAYDVLAGDARSWGGPGGVGRAGRARAHPVAPARARPSELEGGRTDAEPVGRRWPWPPPRPGSRPRRPARPTQAARRRAGRPDPRRGRRGVPDTEVVGDPVDRLPHVVTFSCLYVDGEALVARARPARLRRGVRVGLHRQHARAEPRPGGDGRADPRQRAGHPAPGGRGARPRRRRRARSCAVLPDAVAAVPGRARGAAVSRVEAAGDRRGRRPRPALPAAGDPARRSRPRRRRRAPSSTVLGHRPGRRATTSPRGAGCAARSCDRRGRGRADGSTHQRRTVVVGAPAPLRPGAAGPAAPATARAGAAPAPPRAGGR